MAQTYRAKYAAVAVANNRHMATIWNGSGSGRIVRVTRIWITTKQTASVSGVITKFSIYKMTADGSNGTTITPIAYDTSSEAIPAQVTFRYNPTADITYDTNVLYRSMCFSTDEYAVADATIDGVQTMIPIMVMWDTGYGESDLQFLTLREGEGITIFNTPSTVGTVNIDIEFTMGAS